MSKYRNKKVMVDGLSFDSKKEAQRWRELSQLERAGAITDLRRQVKFTLIPAQRENTGEVYTRGAKKGLPKPGKLLEREVSYVADFVYWRTDSVEKIVEDTKGFRTKEYVIKRKLMLFIYGLKIREV